jgi:transcriptional regulator with XRE-family HTH domain
VQAGGHGVTAEVRPNPTVARRRLAALLRAARERRGRTAEELSEFLSFTAAQVSRLETGARGYRPTDVARLLDWYGVTGEDRSLLLALASESRKRAWWQQVDLPDGYRTMIGYEQAASTIAEYTSSVVPGLLQIEAYARIAVQSWEVDVDNDLVEQAVEVRLKRQDVLQRRPRPQLTVIIDEGALARGPRDIEVHRAQLAHLHRMTSEPGTVIQVIGFEFGLHLGLGKHLIMLGMGGEVPDLVYSEAVLEPRVSEADADVQFYRRVWDELRSAALDKAASRRRIADYLRRNDSPLRAGRNREEGR